LTSPRIWFSEENGNPGDVLECKEHVAFVLSLQLMVYCSLLLLLKHLSD